MTALTLDTLDQGKTCIIARPGIAFFQLPAGKVPALAADLRAFVQLSPDVESARLGTAWLIVKTSEMLWLADQLDEWAAAHTPAGAQLIAQEVA